MVFSCYDNDLSNKNNLQTSSYEVRFNFLFILDVHTNQTIGYKIARTFLNPIIMKLCIIKKLLTNGNHRKESVNKIVSDWNILMDYKYA